MKPHKQKIHRVLLLTAVILYFLSLLMLGALFADFNVLSLFTKITLSAGCVCLFLTAGAILAAEYTYSKSSSGEANAVPHFFEKLSMYLFEDDGKYENGELVSEVLNTQAQLAALQNQINPHFLYNTLESIRSKALIHDENEIASMTETLAKLFRYNIGRGNGSASIADELENIKNYVSIQNYRFRDKFDLRIDVDEIRAVLETYRIPTLTLQPIVENAIHYGLEKKTGKGTILLSGYLTDTLMLLQINDDGVGMSGESLDAIREKLKADGGIPVKSNSASKGSGIALVNVHRRIRLMYGDRYGLEITSAPDIGTQVSVLLPPPDMAEA